MIEIRTNIKSVKNLTQLGGFLRLSGISLVLFAETHGLLSETEVQKEIIKNVHFDSFLYELLEDKKLTNRIDKEKLLNEPDNKDFSIISKFRDLKPTVLLSKEFDIPLIGCDFKNTGRENTDFRENKELTKEEQEQEDNFLIKREKKQLKVIKDYTKSGSVFASIGAYHLRPGSYLISHIKDNFIVIFPVFKDGELFGRRENFNEEDLFYNIFEKKNFKMKKIKLDCKDKSK